MLVANPKLAEILNEYSNEGLRTLVIAKKVLDVACSHQHDLTSSEISEAQSQTWAGTRRGRVGRVGPRACGGGNGAAGGGELVHLRFGYAQLRRRLQQGVSRVWSGCELGVNLV